MAFQAHTKLSSLARSMYQYDGSTYEMSNFLAFRRTLSLEKEMGTAKGVTKDLHLGKEKKTVGVFQPPGEAFFTFLMQ